MVVKHLSRLLFAVVDDICAFQPGVCFGSYSVGKSSKSHRRNRETHGYGDRYVSMKTDDKEREIPNTVCLWTDVQEFLPGNIVEISWGSYLINVVVGTALR